VEKVFQHSITKDFRIGPKEDYAAHSRYVSWDCAVHFGPRKGNLPPLSLSPFFTYFLPIYVPSSFLKERELFFSLISKLSQQLIIKKRNI
jgi:hypothetical protein